MFSNTLTSKTLFTLFIFILILTLALPPAASAQACGDAVPLQTGTTERLYSTAGEIQCFTIDIPAAGIAQVEALGPVGLATQPKLGLVSFSCDGGCGGATAQILEQRPSATLLHFPGRGRFKMRIAAQDPSVALEAYRLIVRFAAMDTGNADGGDSLNEPNPEDQEVDIELLNEPNPEDQEVDIELLTTGNGLPGTDGNSLNEPNPEDQEVDIELLTIGGVPAEGIDLARVRSILCSTAEDDHDESFLCATAVGPGGRLRGTLRNDWGDDADTAVFTLDRMETVRIKIAGDTALSAELYDRSGLRLMAESGVAGRGIVKQITLPAGVYFVRVAAQHGGEGHFNLSLNPSEW